MAISLGVRWAFWFRTVRYESKRESPCIIAVLTREL